MPHIELKLYPGYSDECLERLTADLVSAVSRDLSVPERYVSVACEVVPPEKWETQVTNALIKDRAGLLKAPNYD